MQLKTFGEALIHQFGKFRRRAGSEKMILWGIVSHPEGSRVDRAVVVSAIRAISEVRIRPSSRTAATSAQGEPSTDPYKP